MKCVKNKCIFSLLGLYLVASTDEGGLGLIYVEKGNILANVTAIQLALVSRV